MINNTWFNDNKPSQHGSISGKGGGIYVNSDNENLTFQNVTFFHNMGIDTGGGCIYFE